MLYTSTGQVYHDRSSDSSLDRRPRGPDEDGRLESRNDEGERPAEEAAPAAEEKDTAAPAEPARSDAQSDGAVPKEKSRTRGGYKANRNLEGRKQCVYCRRPVVSMKLPCTVWLGRTTTMWAAWRGTRQSVGQQKKLLNGITPGGAAKRLQMLPIGNFLPPSQKALQRHRRQLSQLRLHPAEESCTTPRRKVISGVVVTAAVGTGAVMIGNVTNAVAAVRTEPPAVTVRMTSRWFWPRFHEALAAGLAAAHARTVLREIEDVGSLKSAISTLRGRGAEQRGGADLKKIRRVRPKKKHHPREKKKVPPREKKIPRGRGSARRQRRKRSRKMQWRKSLRRLWKKKVRPAPARIRTRRAPARMTRTRRSLRSPPRPRLCQRLLPVRVRQNRPQSQRLQLHQSRRRAQAASTNRARSLQSGYWRLPWKWLSRNLET